MEVTVIALMCQLMGKIELCHQAVVTDTAKSGVNLVLCIETDASAPAIIRWKENSRYTDAKWFIKDVECKSGNGYEVETL